MPVMTQPSTSGISAMQSTEATLLSEGYNLRVMQLFLKSHNNLVFKIISVFRFFFHPILISYCGL